MKKTYTNIVMDCNGNILHEEWFWDYRVPALCCGPTQQQKQTYQDQSSLFHTMMNQAQQIFGNSSKVFNDLVSTFQPIVAAGPNQQGFSPAENAARESQIVTQGGISARNAMTAAKQAGAASGGGNMALPGGAEIGLNAAVANAAAQNTSNNLIENTKENYATGRQNWAYATQGLAGAPSVFNPATGAAGAASGAGSNAANTANQIATQGNSWVNAVAGLAGGVVKQGLGMMTGGATSAIPSSFSGSPSADLPLSGANPIFTPQISGPSGG